MRYIVYIHNVIILILSVGDSNNSANLSHANRSYKINTLYNCKVSHLTKTFIRLGCINYTLKTFYMRDSNAMTLLAPPNCSSKNITDTSGSCL